MEIKTLKRDISRRWLGGICSGLGLYFKIDPIFWRLIFIFGTLFTIFPFIFLYIIMWIIVPKENKITK